MLWTGTRLIISQSNTTEQSAPSARRPQLRADNWLAGDLPRARLGGVSMPGVAPAESPIDVREAEKIRVDAESMPFDHAGHRIDQSVREVMGL
jgi:hypothetical protein